VLQCPPSTSGHFKMWQYLRWPLEDAVFARIVRDQTAYAPRTAAPCSHSDTLTRALTQTKTYALAHEVSGCVPDAAEGSHKRWSGLRRPRVRSHL